METDRRQPTGPDAGAFPGFEDLKKLIEKFQLPSLDIDALIDWQRKDMEALTEASQQASEGIKALVARRNEILRETLAEWQAAVKDATSAEAISKRADVAKQGIEKAIADFRELFEMEAQSRNNAWKIVQERMQENMVNLQKLLQPK
ncbi:MAG TPA: phasin family protein [Bradyrhizobium sp.]|jgi:phasin family protein|uniref:phasin family protein n=1 Tax=Bradyrhizobium sp. TaxID=376 RepID=UPI002BBD53A7|nr:phasin family protein [Bradyrhizobium sp.]HXB79047.1 phasin family protein [Bradyrhizobium sp.]